MARNLKFSHQLSRVVRFKENLTIKDLDSIFVEKSFYLIILVLMALPALPIPTGGITHVFEIIVMILSIELILGVKNIWLPKKLLSKKLPQSFKQSRSLNAFIKTIKFFEKYSKPRFKKIVNNPIFIKLTGMILLILTIFAFLAPPFSGMDTLPSLGVFIISLGLIFEDLLLSIFGFFVGIIGVGIVLILGRLAFNFLG